MIILKLLKNALAYAKASGGRQMQVESPKSRLRGLPRAFHLPFRQAILCRGRIYASPTVRYAATSLPRA